ncbi:hypothetical protein FRB99_004207 [Tulasnella sp. 403]|nr:hypothetical protein FRB99_004207 [Tulasnella sp. 403]
MTPDHPPSSGDGPPNQTPPQSTVHEVDLADVPAAPEDEIVQQPSATNAEDEKVDPSPPPPPPPNVPEEQIPALVVRWYDRGTVIPNLQNPRSYTHRQKMGIVATVAIASFSAPFASNILMPSFPFIGPSLRLGHTGVTLTTTMFLVALGLGPLYHAFLCEKFGRRPIYLCGFSLYTLASVACALSPDGDALVVCRFFQAFGSSAAQSLGMGTIADIYIPSERGRATGFWYLGPILGPMISPLIGGSIYQWLGWRAVLWATAFFGILLLTLIVLFLPETSLKLRAEQANPPEPLAPLPEARPKPKTYYAKQAAFQTYNYGIRPLGTIYHLAFPPIGLAALYATICFGSLYAISVAAPFSYAKPPYLLHSLGISLLYLPPCVAYCVGSVVGGYLSDREIRIAKERYGEDAYPPEVRMRSARWGMPLVPAGLLIFGWGLHRHTHLALPATGAFVFGIGFMLTNGTIMAYFTDAVPGQTASVVAAYNALRNVFAGFISAVTTMALQSGLQEGWFMSIMAILCLIGSLNLEIIQIRGPEWRRKRQERIEAERARTASQAVSTKPHA